MSIPVNKTVLRNIWIVLSSIPEEEVSVNALTELMYRSSGRGSPHAISIINACNNLGYVRFRTKGRARFVSITPEGRNMLAKIRSEFEG